MIREALLKRNCVIQGPPGTGKSQTIANLIVALAAEGLKVLFVAEKRAALEVVQQRLQQRGLGHLLLDFHSADISRRAVMEQFAESLRLVREAPPVNCEDAHRQFVDRRKRLNDHAARIHDRRSPSGKSVFELQGELLRFSLEERNDIRFRGETLKRLTPEKTESVEKSLQELGGESMADLFLGDPISLGSDIKVTTRSDTQQILARVERMAYPDLDSSFLQLTAVTGFKTPRTLDEIKEQVELVESVAVTLSRYSEKLFQENLERRIKELEPARHGFFSEQTAWIFNGDFKNAAYTLRKLNNNLGDLSAGEILQDITKASEQLKLWRSLTSTNSTPCKVPNVKKVREHLNRLSSELPDLESLLNRRNLSQMPLNEFADLLRTLSSEKRYVLEQITRVRGIEKELDGLGISSFLNELKRTRSNRTIWRNQFKYAWLASCLDQARSETPELISFDGRNHERVIQEFRELDRERLDLAVQRVYRAHAERAIEAMNRFPDQEDLVRREAEKRARHLSLRRLLSQTPDVLTALRPCWMASPLSVSQLLDADRRYFDVVIFDEASQVLPEDAIPAILRAERAVIAGDKHQLPPTTFFTVGADESEEESESSAEGFESLLDLMSSFLEPKMLEWHYRSRCEELIAFSNRHIYGDRLVTFPNPARSGCVTHVLVPSDFDRDGQEESSSGEVQRVVDLVLEHATESPDRTLGVIAMGIKHADRIEAALDRSLKNRPELEAFFDYNRSERFFSKNIERVQGDERDVIILSIGYGKDRSGRLPYRFGPLLYEGGERRLNVAITRARQRLILVSSFDHRDMDPNRSSSRGVELLRLYLEFATSEGRVLGDSGLSGVPLNDFEADIFNALSARGISLVPQWGVSGYRIDMVAEHPERDGRFVLAIECDGASYHSLPTVRDRDRLRQQQLEALGWRFHRVWSTDWLTRRETEIERAVAAYQAAVQYAEQIDDRRSEPDRQFQVEFPVATESTRSTSDIRPRREQRPDLPRYDRIDRYTTDELMSLIRWILSDDYLRTDDEIVQEMVRELGFKRLGVKIKARVLDALQKVKESLRGY